jgi:hypothetical protein
MKLEIFIFGLIALFLYDAYHKQKYTNMILSYKKHFKTLFWIFTLFSLYIYVKKAPLNGQNMLYYANNVIKSMPIDKSTMHLLSPVIDFTKGKSFMERVNVPIVPVEGAKPTKRCVSETKKKFVASQQGWKCNDCKEQLNAWYEVDHVIRLEYGGGNGTDNLVALCRECHGRKTAMENM